ncbi:hypothetical protein F4779DRAFT_575332 [Xylariaceae sp. FL0662B]|nr:hypothetical protein F4779DRAFT_575332 [Xylariaceae sp. FL0662B]
MYFRLLLITLASLLLISSSTASQNISHSDPLKRGKDICYFDGSKRPFVGIRSAHCSTSNAKDHTDILTCPDQGVADRICGRDDVSATVRNNCQAIVGGGSYCTVGGDVGVKDSHFQCFCVNGNFCCHPQAEVPGGKHPVTYFKEHGCTCGKET